MGVRKRKAKTTLDTRRLKLAGKLAAVAAVCLLIRAMSDMLAGAGWLSLPTAFSEYILESQLPYSPKYQYEHPASPTSQLESPPASEDTSDIVSPGSSGEVPSSASEDTSDTPAAEEASENGTAQDEPGGAISTTITGEGGGYHLGAEGIYLKNNTEYTIDVEGLLNKPLDFSFSDGAQVLIIHTHGSEAYMPDGDDIYEPSDPSRTEDRNFNVIRVGDELESVLKDRGIQVIHDRQLYDYPSYNGSYTRSLEAIEDYLEKYPDIAVVIDLHRDALEGTDGTIYKTVAQVGSDPCAQVMLICGTDFSGLNHENWQKNLSFALKIQSSMVQQYPTLARPLNISQNRYNQQATTGSLIAEIGCNGNTLQEALAAVRYFGDCLADVLLS